MHSRQTIIKDIGCQVRSFLEVLQPNTSWCQHLSGACAVGAYITHKLLLREEINSNIIIGTGSYTDHCWVDIKLDNDLIVLDTTATQFDKDLNTVLLLPKVEYKQLIFHKEIPSERLFMSDNILFKALSGWDPEQHPNTYWKEIHNSFGIIMVD